MKTLYKTLLLLFLNTPFLIFNSYGQGENNIWYFGHFSGLDFNSGSPVALTNSQMDQWEGTATVSDAAGNLLFYTDGITVWNRNHVPMNNGTGLSGNYSSTHSATIVPKPGSSTEYYVFTCQVQIYQDSLRYSIVDMSLDGGDGDVALKNIGLHAHSSEKCVAIYKDGSPDVWVIGHNTDTVFYSYLITASGINLPVISYHQPNQGSWVIGCLKASSPGSKIAAGLYTTIPPTNKFGLFDFDCTTGIISNEMFIDAGDKTYGLEFSPDGSKLYVFPWNGGFTPIFQYDVTLNTAAAIAASQVTVATSSGAYLGAGQIGPDQKIYIAVDNHDSLSVINNPNMAGAACNFMDNAIYLGGNTSGIGLPALIRGSICGTTSISQLSNAQFLFSISPNPSSGIFQITFPSSSNQKPKYTLEIINTLGQTVFAKQLETRNPKPETTLDVSFLPKGIYVLKINDSVSALSSKFVIE